MIYSEKFYFLYASIKSIWTLRISSSSALISRRNCSVFSSNSFLYSRKINKLLKIKFYLILRSFDNFFSWSSTIVRLNASSISHFLRLYRLRISFSLVKWFANDVTSVSNISKKKSLTEIQNSNHTTKKFFKNCSNWIITDLIDD